MATGTWSLTRVGDCNVGADAFFAVASTVYSLSSTRKHVFSLGKRNKHFEEGPSKQNTAEFSWMKRVLSSQKAIYAIEACDNQWQFQVVIVCNLKPASIPESKKPLEAVSNKHQDMLTMHLPHAKQVDDRCWPSLQLARFGCIGVSMVPVDSSCHRFFGVWDAAYNGPKPLGSIKVAFGPWQRWSFEKQTTSEMRFSGLVFTKVEAPIMGLSWQSDFRFLGDEAGKVLQLPGREACRTKFCWLNSKLWFQEIVDMYTELYRHVVLNWRSKSYSRIVLHKQAAICVKISMLMLMPILCSKFWVKSRPFRWPPVGHGGQRRRQEQLEKEQAVQVEKGAIYFQAFVPCNLAELVLVCLNLYQWIILIYLALAVYDVLIAWAFIIWHDENDQWCRPGCGASPLCIPGRQDSGTGTAQRV